MNVSSPLSFDRILLMGFMGSGKTTVGRLLAARIGWQLADLDSAVEKRCGQTVPRIFADFGEQHFRNEESAALRGLAERTQVVIALGGGATERPVNQALLRQLSRTSLIYLQAPFAELQERCSRQAAEPYATSRPLLTDIVAAQKRFELRQPVYRELASLEVDTTDLTPQQVVERILLTLD